MGFEKSVSRQNNHYIFFGVSKKAFIFLIYFKN